MRMTVARLQIRAPQQVAERSPASIGTTIGARAGAHVSVPAALRTQACAVFFAQRLHRLSEDELLSRSLTEIQYMVLVDYERCRLIGPRQECARNDVDGWIVLLLH